MTPAFSDWGYSGTMRPVLSPTRSTSGLVICRRPPNSSTLPNRTTLMPDLSWRWR